MRKSRRFVRFLFRGCRKGLHSFEDVAILDIEGIAIHDEEILKTVQVHVEEDRLPRHSELHA